MQNQLFKRNFSVVIGNDIIDLKLALSERKSESMRFLNKVFTEREKDIIESSEEPETTLWLLWSMKETAYKAHQRNFSLPRSLNPKSFDCILVSGKKGVVQKGEYKYEVRSEIDSDSIHTYIAANRILKKVFPQKYLSKQAILESICFNFNLPNTAGSIEKDCHGIPYLNLDKHTKKLPLSLSHHGDFTAFIIPLINS